MSKTYTQVYNDNPVSLPTDGEEIFVVTQNGQSKGIKLKNLHTGNVDISGIVATVTVGGITPGYTTTTLAQFIADLIAPYVHPAFNSFSVTGQATVVERGTTLSGSKTFTWSIAVGGGTVATIDIYDNTAAATLLSNTANDGSQSVTITTITLTAAGQTQSWKGILHNTDPAHIENINSSNFVVVARLVIWYGHVSANTSTSANVRALPQSGFHNGAGSVVLATGTTDSIFEFWCPGTLVSVFDQTISADITSEYVSIGTRSIQDAAGTNYTCNGYRMTQAIPYGGNHNHQITYTS